METKKDKFKKWYKRPENKTWMREYMKKYYKENKDKLLIYQKEVRNNYNRPLKNIIRDKIIDIMGRYKIEYVLTLESHKFLFSKKLPEKSIIVYEKDKEEFGFMVQNKPKNVTLIQGDISDYTKLHGRVDCVYLDFCGNWYGSKETILNLKEVINNSKLFVITLSSRDNQIEIEGDYQFFYINQLQELLGNLKVIYGEAYRENNNSAPMVTIVFEVVK
jgi:hypothetical protein